jgi:UDP-N-acetylmuramyl pentapeptide synthase
MAFNFKQYTSNNPLLQPLKEDGPDVTVGDMMAYGADQEVGEPLEEDDVKDIEAYGSDMEEMEEEVNYDKVNATVNDTLEAMRKSIKTHGLSNDDVYELRIKLAQFFA